MNIMGEITRVTIRDKNDERTELFEVVSVAGVSSQSVRLQGAITVQVSGTASNVKAVVERSSGDPGSPKENWAPAEDRPFEGDLSQGMAPREYAEPSIGWWRVRVPTLSDGSVQISIVGESA